MPSRKELWLLYWIGENWPLHPWPKGRAFILQTSCVLAEATEEGCTGSSRQCRCCCHAFAFITASGGCTVPSGSFLGKQMGQPKGMLGNCPACFWARDQERVLSQELTAVSGKVRPLGCWQGNPPPSLLPVYLRIHVSPLFCLKNTLNFPGRYLSSHRPAELVSNKEIRIT